MSEQAFEQGGSGFESGGEPAGGDQGAGAGESWTPPSREEWQGMQEQLAWIEQQVAAEQAQAAEWELADAHQALQEGDPGAVERLHELNMQGVEERIAPLLQWAEGLQNELALVDGEERGYALADEQITRLGVEGVSREQVWERGNELLAQAQQRALNDPELTPDQTAVFYGPEAAKAAIRMAAEEFAGKRGDESAVLARYQRPAPGVAQGGRPARPPGVLPGWATDLVNKV